MLSKKEAKDIQSLAQKKFRKETNLFVAEGPKIVEELVKALPQQLERVYALPQWVAANEEHLDTVSSLLTVVQEADLARISHLTTPNQVLAVVKQFSVVRPAYSGFTLYLDAIQDPGNFGTILRTADWFGIGNIVCSAGCADVYNPKVIQASMASAARVAVYYDLEESWLAGATTSIYAAVLEGSSVYDESKTAEGVLLIGNESKGIRPDWLPLASKRITIPRKGRAESLNAAVATGIILSHLIG